MTTAPPRRRDGRALALRRDDPRASSASASTSRSLPHDAKRTAPSVSVRRAEPVPSPVFDTYWRFAAERQAIYHRRVAGRRGPWTDDAILSRYKFTNAYRAADRVSQFLIAHVVYAPAYDAFDTVLRTLAFKLFNKVETWRLLEGSLGQIDVRSFDVERFDRVLSTALRGGATIYSAAYIMPSGPASIRQPRKHRMHLGLLDRLIHDGTIRRLLASGSMRELYNTLVSLPGLGPFLAYQFATDLNYGAHFSFSEMEFVMPGPGARDGLRKCFLSLGDYTEADAIRWVADRQDQEFRSRGLEFQSLWGRPLQLIDCQNLFCEVDKYARVAHPDAIGYSGRTQIKQRFAPRSSVPTPWFPPKWGLNARIAGVDYSLSAEHRTLAAEVQALRLGIE